MLNALLPFACRVVVRACGVRDAWELAGDGGQERKDRHVPLWRLGLCRFSCRLAPPPSIPVRQVSAAAPVSGPILCLCPRALLHPFPALVPTQRAKRLSSFSES